MMTKHASGRTGFDSTYPDVAGCGWLPKHKWAYSTEAKARLRDAEGSEHEACRLSMRRGEVDGLYCSVCGVSAAEFIAWPSVICMPRERIAQEFLCGVGVLEVGDADSN